MASIFNSRLDDEKQKVRTKEGEVAFAAVWNE